jgi:hypothetical protein
MTCFLKDTFWWMLNDEWIFTKSCVRWTEEC